MRERRDVLMLVAGFALAAASGFGWAFDLGPPPAVKLLAFAGVALILIAQQRMARLPGDDEP
jgi:hypothetical protein